MCGPIARDCCMQLEPETVTGKSSEYKNKHK